MNFDTTSDDIILISYPSGGFGNFIYHVLTEFANETVKVNNKFKFSIDGNSHTTKKYTEIYFQDHKYTPIIGVDPGNKKILVLCDNGIINDSYNKINKTFPNSTIIRMVIDEDVRPVIYKTLVEKAIGSNLLLTSANHVNKNWSTAGEDYAIRENFTLLYHNWMFKWDYINSKNIVNLSIKKLISNPINAIVNLVNQLGLTIYNIDELIKFCSAWLLANKIYLDLYFKSLTVMTALHQGNNVDLLDIKDLHHQGYINYCIEKQFSVTIPVYDYRDWFKNTNQIQEMIKCLK